MKILHVIDSGGLYGAEVMLLTLCEELQKLGHQVVIASIGSCGVTNKPLEGEARRRGILVETFRFRNGPNPFGAWKLLSYAKSKRFDIIHSHGYKGNILLGFIPRKVRGIPMLCTVHGWTSTGGFSLLRLYEYADSMSYRLLDAVVLVHDAMHSHRKFSGKDLPNVTVINNGIPVEEPGSGDRPPAVSRERHEEIRAFCSRRKTIGAIGRLTEEKGFRYLVEAFKVVVSAGSDVNLIIIGEGPERTRLETMATLHGLQDRFMLAGYIPEASRYLSCLAMYVISSMTEGLPISLLEAMRARIPVVSTKVGGIEDVLDRGTAGIVVPPCEPEALAEGLMRMLSDRGSREPMVARAAEIFERRFTSTVMASNYINTYAAVIRMQK